MTDWIVRQAVTATDLDRPSNAEDLPSEPTGINYTQRAQQFAERGDWVSAYYSAARALEINIEDRAARQVAEQALQRLELLEARPQENEDRTLFTRIQRAYQTLIVGDDPLEAYTLFWELAREHPANIDIETHLADALRASRRVAFYTEELPHLKGVSDVGPLILLYERNDERMGVLTAQRLFDSPLGFYLFDIEALSADRSTGLRYHLQADWGKLIEGQLIMRLVDHDDPRRRFEPRYRVGDSLPGYSLPLMPDPQEIIYAARLLADSRALTMVEPDHVGTAHLRPRDRDAAGTTRARRSLRHTGALRPVPRAGATFSAALDRALACLAAAGRRRSTAVVCSQRHCDRPLRSGSSPAT